MSTVVTGDATATGGPFLASFSLGQDPSDSDGSWASDCMALLRPRPQWKCKQKMSKRIRCFDESRQSYPFRCIKVFSDSHSYFDVPMHAFFIYSINHTL